MSTDIFFEDALSHIGRVSEKLMACNMMLGTAESCTGGLVAALCTSVPGSSRWFCGSVVSYANSVKTHLLGVDALSIAKFGAVSAPVVESMAKGGLAALGCDLCVAVSGVAGPDGGTVDKPVGTVWIATAVREEGTPLLCSFVEHFSGTRQDVRVATAFAAFKAIAAALGDR